MEPPLFPWLALAPGYKPCDPQVIRDRVAHMEFCYQELSQLAAERRARLRRACRVFSRGKIGRASCRERVSSPV